MRKVFVLVLLLSVVLGIRPSISGAQAQSSSFEIIGAAVCGEFGSGLNKDLCLIHSDYSIEMFSEEGDAEHVAISGDNLYVAFEVGKMGEYAPVYGVFMAPLAEAAEGNWQRVDTCTGVLSCGNWMYPLADGAVSYTVSTINLDEPNNNAWGYSQTQWNSWSPESGTAEEIQDNGFRSLSFQVEESETEIVPGVPSWVRFIYPTPFEGWNYEDTIVRSLVDENSFTEKWVPTVMNDTSTVGLSLETTSTWGFPHYTQTGFILSGRSELIVWVAEDRTIEHFALPEGQYILGISIAGEIPQRPQ